MTKIIDKSCDHIWKAYPMPHYVKCVKCGKDYKYNEQKMNNFKQFYFEGNLYFGYIKNKSDLKNLLKAYDGSHIDIRKAQSINPIFDVETETPSFGFYWEYDGDLTLGKWIDNNNLNEFFAL